MEEFKDSPTAGVYDVDCTADGKDLCEKHEVSGYPTIKYGDPGDMKDYQGGRTYEALKKFAEENLGPTCGPANMDLCSDDMKKKIEGYQKLSQDKLEEKIKKATNMVEVETPIMKKVMAWAKKKADL